MPRGDDTPPESREYELPGGDFMAAIADGLTKLFALAFGVLLGAAVLLGWFIFG